MEGVEGMKRMNSWEGGSSKVGRRKRRKRESVLLLLWRMKLLNKWRLRLRLRLQLRLRLRLRLRHGGLELEGGRRVVSLRSKNLLLLGVWVFYFDFRSKRACFDSCSCNCACVCACRKRGGVLLLQLLLCLLLFEEAFALLELDPLYLELRLKMVLLQCESLLFKFALQLLLWRLWL